MLTMTNERGLGITAGAAAELQPMLPGLSMDRLQCCLLAVPERPISAPLRGSKAPPAAVLGMEREWRLF